MRAEMRDERGGQMNGTSRAQRNNPKLCAEMRDQRGSQMNSARRLQKNNSSCMQN